MPSLWQVAAAPPLVELLRPALFPILNLPPDEISGEKCSPGALNKRIHAWHSSCEESRRLEEIPGIGPIVDTALVAEIGDWKQFRSGRSLAAWIGLVPKQHSTGGKDRLGSITTAAGQAKHWL